ncbi:MAG: Omp28-related outer membrane protein, partial [Rikenellaceae bacterium]|nr:Omp28-related outer membrane protein [Rikenellaceae bacterium]
ITESTKNKPISVQVINDAIPDRAEDPNPTSTSFKRRAMVMQFTGTNCGFCPYIIEPLETMAADAAYKDKFSWAAIHTFNDDDPAKPSNSADATNLPDINGLYIRNYPTVVVDLGTLVVNSNNNIALNLANLKKAVDNSVANAASAGISATMTFDENNRVVTARVSVKAKDAKVYRVSMWLIEDKINGLQNGSSTIKSHDNAVRYVARGADGSADYVGYPLNDGKTMNPGQVCDYVFSIKISDQSIKPANCQLALFVTTSVGNNKYTVVNSAVTKDLKTALPFEYNN